MANKIIKYTFVGANQDVSKSKHPIEFYYEANHIKLLSTNSQSTGSVANEKGNKKVVSIPNITINTNNYRLEYNNNYIQVSPTHELINQIYGVGTPRTNMIIEDNTIIGHVNTRNGIILFTTNDQGIDCIWNLDDIVSNRYTLSLLYTRKLEFSIENPIQAIFNYENENIQKVYWVDGKSQIRFINTKHNTIPGNSSLIDIPYTNINFVGQINYTQPKVIDINTGGSHTAGMIQYAYNLFRLNGSQTKISPLSKLVPLGKGDRMGGGDVNEKVGASPVVKIEGLDTRYTHLRLYAIKYTSFNEIPSVSLIDEREFISDTVTVMDDGSVIDTLSLAEFLYLGSDPLVPKHIETKDSRLFPANISTKSFILGDEFDFRAYSFKKYQPTTKVVDDIISYENNNIQAEGWAHIDNNFVLQPKHSGINPDYDSYKYLINSSTIGGSGKLLSYELLQYTESQLDDDPENLKFFKDEEIYRIGIHLYNELGQISDPKWIADFKSLNGNLSGNYNVLKVNLTQAFIDLVQTYNIEHPESRIIGYKILRADRGISDRTIIDQGILSNMLFQSKDREYLKSHPNPDPTLYVDEALKVPAYAIRHANNYPSMGGTNTYPLPGRILVGNDVETISIYDGILFGNKHMRTLNYEIFVGTGEDSKLQYGWIHDKMIQSTSPATVFDESFNLSNGLSLQIKGMVNITKAYSWIEERDINSKKEKYGGKIEGAINLVANVNDPNLVVTRDNGIPRALYTPADGSYGKWGFINPTGNGDTMNFRMYYREYGDFNTAPVRWKREIYGTPELTERGQGATTYNKDGRFKYTNSLQSIISDKRVNNDSIVPISNVNSYAARNITMVLGNSRDISTSDRAGLESIYNATKIKEQTSSIGDGILIGELIKPKSIIYMGNIYGGNRYEDKRRTKYSQIGDYKDLDSTNVVITSPGDTFVQMFKLMRVGKTDTEVYSGDSFQTTDIINYPVETTIDLKNRNDLSLGEWDNVFQPLNEDYTNYNKVYSQDSVLVKNQTFDYKFNEVKNFTTRIQASKVKIPNETIDSWTDMLVNETIELDNKYGPINNIISFRDNIYSFQDEGIALIRINPTAQITSDEGILIELGKGGILDSYNYITTNSGSINKWGMIAGKKGIYYYDALNKAIGRVPDAVEFLLSDMKGMHSFYNKNYNYTQLKRDNPLLLKGALFGADIYNNDIYFTLLQNNTPVFNTNNPDSDVNITNIIEPTTWCFNEATDQFIDLKPKYNNPKLYINKGDKLLLSKDANSLYEHYAGDYNKFFDEYSPSTITLVLNPESDLDTVFDNIHYNSEVYLNDIDQPDKTLTHIRAWNEYQDSGRIPLIVGRGSNIRRKFREWQADIPREGRDRIRNTWIYLYLELDNKSNYKMILHDIIIRYTV